MFELYSYTDMIAKTEEFYSKLNIKINDIKLAVASLTMTEFAKNYNDVNSVKIDNQDALATVGDSICGSYVMIKEYGPFATMEYLTNKKDIVTNNNLKIVGKKLLEGYLFHANNDLKEGNKKDYATAFEAIIGFIALNNPNDIKPLLDKYLKTSDFY